MKEIQTLEVLWCECGEPVVKATSETGWTYFFSREGLRIHECPRCRLPLRRLHEEPPAHVRSRRVCRFCFSEYGKGRRLGGRGCLICNASPEKVLIPYPEIPRIVLRNFERMEIAR